MFLEQDETTTVNGTINLCLQAAMKESICQIKEDVTKTRENLVSFRVSFMNIGNVTMVSVLVENFQIQKAVDLRRRTSCEMQKIIQMTDEIKKIQQQLETLQISFMDNGRTHMALSSVQHTVQSHFTFHIPHSPTDTL